MKEDLPNVLHAVIASYLSGVFTAMPGIIQSYDKNTKTVSVLPSIKTTFLDGEIQSKPIITNVPVMFPGTKKAVMQYKLEKGDGCLLIFSSESLEKWINSSGGMVEVGDTRRFALTDAFCIPGVFPPKSPGKVASGDGLEIIYDNGKIVLTPDGKIELNGDSKQFVTHAELNTALQNFVTGLSTYLLTGANGGGPVVFAGVYPTLNISSAKTTTVKTGG
jgi:hypothetical protein